MAAKRKTKERKMESEEKVPEEAETPDKVDSEEGEKYSGGPIPNTSSSEQKED
jgi:hypothetical protein